MLSVAKHPREEGLFYTMTWMDMPSMADRHMG